MVYYYNLDACYGVIVGTFLVLRVRIFFQVIKNQKKLGQETI